MMACLDVHYRGTDAYAAGVVFRDWRDATPAEQKVVLVGSVLDYQPGEFFRRELPCLLAVLRVLPPVETVIVDGYVWLDSIGKPGLGGYLYEAFNRDVAVIGVAKTRFGHSEQGCELTRGKSTRPLFITAAGIAPEVAANFIRSMHGRYRIPTLLRLADQLSRHGALAGIRPS